MPNLSNYLLSRFGIALYMYYGDMGQHNKPHVHAFYQDGEAIIEIPNGEVIEGTIHRTALRRVRAWITLNEEAVMERWEKAVRETPITRVD